MLHYFHVLNVCRHQLNSTPFYDELIEAERDIPEEKNQCGATSSRNFPNENDEISGLRADQNSLKKEKGPPSSNRKRSSMLSFMFCADKLTV